MIPPKSQPSSSLRAFLQEEERVHLVDISFALVVQNLHMCKGTGTSQGGGALPWLASGFWVQLSAPGIKHNKQSVQKACYNFAVQEERSDCRQFSVRGAFYYS